MEVQGLLLDPISRQVIVVLKDETDTDVLTIFVGKDIAYSINMALEKVWASRPMTHDLIKNVLDAVQAKVISVEITDLRDHTYFAKLHILYQDSEYTIDSRPSDAVVLALRSDAPIFANAEVIQKHKMSKDDLDEWLENLRPEDFGRNV